MTPRCIDLTGHRYGLVTVLGRAGVYLRAGGYHGHAKWLVRCDCGAERVTTSDTLRGKPNNTHRACKRVRRLTEET